MSTGEKIATAALLLNMVVMICTALVIPRIRLIVREELSSHRAEVDKALAAVSHSAMENNNVTKLEIAAVRQWAADKFSEYVRRETFNLVMAETRGLAKDLGDDIKARLVRIEDHLMGNNRDRDRDNDK